MELQENDAGMIAQQLVRRYTDEPEEKPLEGRAFIAAEGAPDIEKDQRADSQELVFWLKQLDLAKSQS